jgi:hypothetical protein
MFLCPLTPRLWEQFQKLHRDQESLPMQQVPSEVAFVCDSLDFAKQSIISAVVIYKTDGPWLMIENLVTNPAFPMRTRYLATDLCLSSARAVATQSGQWLIACPSKKGIYKFLLKRGFSAPHVVTCVCPPGIGFKL